MTPAAWDVAKDGLGFLGAFLAAVPWFRDFFGRRDVASVRGVPPADERGRSFLKKIEARARQRFEEPRLSDLLCQLLGLMLIAAAFAVSALRGLRWLG
jgi:hypothetical protein